MGEVYLAEDTKLRRKVAIKRLPQRSMMDDSARKRLLREARAAATLDHPNICAIYEIGQDDNTSFIVMQYVEGETLSERIKRESLGVGVLLDIGIQVADALFMAHSHNIIHRDIKPQNVMITRLGQVKVLDFGLAKSVRREQQSDSDAETQSVITEEGAVIGTVAYMSPEQARGEPLDHRSDLFSFGALLYECATGRLPFRGSNAYEVCAQVIHINPEPPSKFNPSVPRELDSIILKALAKDIDARFQSADEIIADLKRVRDSVQSLEEVPTKTLPPEPNPPAVKPHSSFSRALRRPVPIAAVVIGVLTVLAGLWVISLLQSGSPYQPSPEANRWYDVGTNALREGAYFQASKALESAVQVDEKFALAHARLAEAYTELDYADKAKDELLRVSSLVPDRSKLPPLDALYLKAITDTVSRNFEGAIESYSDITRRQENEAYAYVDLGRAYEKGGEIEKAVENYQKATELDSLYAAAFLRLGIVRGRKEGLSSAEAAFTKAENIYRTQNNFEGLAEVLYQRGSLLNNMDKLSEARVQLQEALRITDTTVNEYQRIKILLQLSSVSATEGDMTRAHQYATEAIDLARAKGIENLTTRGLNDLGNAFFLRGDYSEAEKYFRQALEFAQRYKGRNNEARALLSLGSLHLQRGDVEEGISFVEMALAFYQTGGYRKETSLCLLLLGRANRQRGDYDAALQAFEQQLQLARHANDPSQVAAAYSSIGHVLDNKEQYVEALSHLEESYKINESLNSLYNAGYDLKSRASILWQLGRYNDAEKALDGAASIADRDADSYKLLLAEIHLVNARMALSQRQLQQAKAKSKQALELAVAQDKYIAVGAKATLGLAEVLSGKKTEGKLLCQEAFDMATHISNPRLLSSTLLILAEALLESGDGNGALKNALQALQTFTSADQQESEWRAYLVAARASRLAGDVLKAREYALHAADVLSGLERKWGPENYKSYLERPDLKDYRKQLGELVSVNK
jgi:serine/threonine protein kinase/ATP/maltotriose-dependent transcriptional regulator MalT